VKVFVCRLIPWALITCATLIAQTAPSARETIQLPLGKIVSSLATIKDPAQTYALYLPTSYRSDRSWPIVYAFDPIARGEVPVGLMQEMAEKYGYILVGSNVSKNGPLQVSNDAAVAMWDDTHVRFNIDPKRHYVTGFSGGARASTLVALLCKDCIAGVIAHGAGFPQQIEPTKDIKFIYYATTGNLDFNYIELLELDRKLDATGTIHRMRYFDGGHEYAKPEVWREIFPWIELHAMKQGRRPKDQTFIDQQFEHETSVLKDLEAKGDRYQLALELKRAIQDFDGVSEIAAWKLRSAELANDKAVKEGEKRKKADIRKQQLLAHDAYRELQIISDEPSERAEPLARFRNQFGEMKKTVVAAREQGRENDPDILPLRRTLYQVLAQCTELGQLAYRRKDYSTALTFFDLVIELARAAPLAHLERARTLAQMGRTKEVLPELRKAMEKGMDASAIREAPEFAGFRAQPEFQQILQIVPTEQIR
jgi:tetratricopeptide (TPR) repeat protein